MDLSAIGIDFEVGFLLLIAIIWFCEISSTGFIKLSENFQSVTIPLLLISTCKEIDSFSSLTLNCETELRESFKNSVQLFPKHIISPLSLRKLSNLLPKINLSETVGEWIHIL